MIKNKKAFTLIEVMYVITIMGILFSIAFPILDKLTYNEKKFNLKEYAFDISRFQIKNFPIFQDYQSIPLSKVTNNFVETDKNKKIFLPNGLYIKTNPIKCSDETTGLYLYLKDPKLDTKEDEIILNTCNSFKFIRK